MLDRFLSWELVVDVAYRVELECPLTPLSVFFKPEEECLTSDCP